MLRWLLLGSLLALSACSTFEADFAQYCQARGELTVGDECGASASCCQPYQCEAARCCAPALVPCRTSSDCCSGLACVEGACEVSTADAGAPDGGAPDSGSPDAGQADADAGAADAGGRDAGGRDAGGGDAGAPDAGEDAGPAVFDAGPLEGLVFLTPPRTTRAGECSAAITVGLFPDAGPLDASVQLLFGGLNEETTLSDDASCANPIVELMVAPGADRASIYLQSTSAGSTLLFVTAAELSLETVQLQRVVANAPVRLSFASPVPFAAGGACSNEVRLVVRDAFFNPSPVAAPLDVHLAAEGTARLFALADSACASPLNPATLYLAPGQSAAGFRFSDVVPGSPRLAAWVGDGGTAEDGGALPGSLLPARYVP